MEPITAAQAQQMANEKNSPPAMEQVYSAIAVMAGNGNYFVYTDSLLSARQIVILEDMGYTVSPNSARNKHRIEWEQLPDGMPGPATEAHLPE